MAVKYINWSVSTTTYNFDIHYAVRLLRNYRSRYDVSANVHYVFNSKNKMFMFFICKSYRWPVTCCLAFTLNNPCYFDPLPLIWLQRRRKKIQGLSITSYLILPWSEFPLYLVPVISDGFQRLVKMFVFQVIVLLEWWSMGIHSHLFFQAAPFFKLGNIPFKEKLNYVSPFIFYSILLS